MPSALRALGTAALAVGQAALTLTDNNTYLATVTLDSVPVKLLVDLQMAGVWVKCSALEGPSCADGIASYSPGYEKEQFERFDKYVARKTKRFKEVEIAGQTFNGFDAYVVYDALPEAGESIQGVLGLRRQSASYGDYASMYLDDQVTTVALQLGTTASDSKLSLDTVDRSLLTKKGLTTAVTASNKMACFDVPLANGSSECTSSSGTVTDDPAFPIVGMYSTTLDTFARRYLYACTPIGGTYRVGGYTCDASVKLPRLSIQVGEWRFFLDPSEYTIPVQGSSQVKLLTGDYPYIYSGWVLGAPFLRKYPFVYNATGDSTLYCKENTTCTKVLPKPSTRYTYSPSYGGGGGGGGGGGSPSYEFDAETRRKRGKLYLAIGLSVGGLVFFAVCGCFCKACMADSTEKEGEDEDAKTKENASVELAVGVAIAVDNASDESDSDTSKKKRLVEKGKTTSRKPASSSGKRKAASRRTKEDRDSSSSEDDSDYSSSYDSESSEERRRERRRRRRRRERRRERDLRRQSEATATTTATTAAGDDPEETHYVAASSPKNSA